MKKLFIIILISFIFPVFVFAQSSNIGIIKGIWFSKDVFFAEDTIRIYTALQNNSGKDINGTVEFFDNDVSLGVKNFNALDRRVTEVWMDSIVSEGSHNYSVVITKAVLEGSNPNEESLVTPRVITSERVIIADFDTDGDGIGNKEDPDDDNDGFTDIEEEIRGTNSLVKEDSPRSKDFNKEANASSQGFISQVVQVLGEIGQNSGSEKNNDLLPTSVENTIPNSDTDNEKTSFDVQIQSPPLVQKLEVSYPVISKVTHPLNKIQNIIVPRVIKEQKKAVNKINPTPSLVLGKNLEKDASNSKADVSEYSHGLTGWRYWVWSIYSWILFGLRWVFSCLLCMIILIFIIIHVLLKLALMMFQNKNS